MNSEQKQAFDLSLEHDALRDRYGQGSFGQGCLMARRLIESGVRFVEVICGRWRRPGTPTATISPAPGRSSNEADQGMAALIEDLEERGRLDSTLVIWIGEFGRITADHQRRRPKPLGPRLE